jgi:hypothetical protein
MGGSGGKGLGDALQFVFDPAGFTIDKVQSRTPLRNLDFIQSFTNTVQGPVQHLNNYGAGTEAFMQPKQHAGSGWIGNIVNPILGSQNDLQRQEDETNIQAWNDYFTGKNRPKPTVTDYGGLFKTESQTGTSLLEEA